MNRTAPLLPPSAAGIALVCGGAMWGLYWIPVRTLNSAGLPGAWAGLVIYAASLLLLSPIIWRDRAALLADWRALAISGALTGAAFSLFTTSLAYTDVARSILLFYLTPVWGTILGVLFLGEHVTRRRLLGLVLGIGGMMAVLGVGRDLPWPKNAGDWLALVSGVTWAIGTLIVFKSRGVAVTGQVVAFLSGGFVVAALTVLVSGAVTVLAVPQMGAGATLGIVLLSALYVLPMVWLTIWPATLLSPARVGLLLMSEVIVGIASAAAFAGEPFGWRETIGALMIVSAALNEVV